MISHLNEFRTRLINSILVFTVIFITCFYYSKELYANIANPILKILPSGSNLIATSVTTPFLIPLKLSLFFSLLIAVPYFLFHIWKFIKPGLYKHERKNILPLLISSILLFYCGLLFAFFVICPLALSFFINCAPQGVQVMTDISSYLDFIVTICFAAGLAFQIPVVTRVLIQANIVTKQQLREKRRYVIVLAFILGMLLTPPDVVSQILLAMPMWGLFELGLLLV